MMEALSETMQGQDKQDATTEQRHVREDKTGDETHSTVTMPLDRQGTSICSCGAGADAAENGRGLEAPRRA